MKAGKSYPVWSPSHYDEGVKAGLTYMQMLDNIDARAVQLGHFFRDACLGILWDIDELAEEARALKAYRTAFVNWGLDPKTSPFNEKRIAREKIVTAIRKRA